MYDVADEHRWQQHDAAGTHETSHADGTQPTMSARYLLHCLLPCCHVIDGLQPALVYWWNITMQT